MFEEIKKLKNEILLKYHEIETNEYIAGRDQLSGFVNHAAKKYNVSIEKKEIRNIQKFYYNDNIIGHLTGLRSSSTRKVALRLCKNKYNLEKYLENFSIPILGSKEFKANEKGAALEYIKKNKEAYFVIKPLSLAGGKGIQLKVTESNFSEKWDNCFEVQSENNIKNKSCLIQPFVDGFDIRVTVIEGRYNAAILRLPAHIIGDGKKNILELIDEKNALRKKNPYFRNKLIPINDKLNRQLSTYHYSESTILNEKEVLVLSDISNLTFGGESIDITNILSKNIKNTALKAVAAIPGLYTAGVDIMTIDFENSDGYIIEINTSGNLSMHHLPLKGEVRYPYFSLMNAYLIKYKIENRIPINKTERKIFSEILTFYDTKEMYISQYMSKCLNISQ